MKKVFKKNIKKVNNYGYKNIGMGIASGFLGGLFGINSQEKQMENQEYLMGLQHKYNEQSADAAQKRAYEMWEKTNYAAQVEQMKKQI